MYAYERSRFRTRVKVNARVRVRVWARVRYLVTSIGFRIGVSDRVRG